MIDNRRSFKRFLNTNPYSLFKNLETPSYVIDEAMLILNGKILKDIEEKTGAKILLAQKAFSNFNCYNLLRQYISGVASSGLYEARLGYEEMNGMEVHTFSAAYREDEILDIIKYSDHIVFNSLNQLRKYGPLCKRHGKSIGIRINPEKSTQKGPSLYDPCSKVSRLGIPLSTLEKELDDDTLNLIDGIHFHTLCQQNSDDLKITLDEVENKFGKYLWNLKWINFGGGHHITRSDYNIDLLIDCINHIKNKYNLEVYLEPGEGVVLDAGYLLTRVLDTYNYNDNQFVIVDTSAACHMPDVLEMPYIPPLYQTDLSDCNKTIYLGGPTCLSGDLIGKYKFSNIPNVNDLLIFGDMALYTMVKNNTFNGMKLPNIYLLKEDNSIEKLTNFSYNDFKYRLGKI